MKITADQLKRMSVSDLKYLERNISSWIYSRDQQKNVAATALGLLTKKPSFTSAKASKFGRVSERHSRALLNCSPGSDSLSNALKGFEDKVIRSGKEPKKTNWKYNFLHKRESTADKTPSTKTNNLKELLNPTVTPTPPVTTQTHVDRITRVEIPKVPEKPAVTENNNVTKPAARKATPVTTTPRRAPLRTRGFPKPMPLRKIVTLREHRRKCEARVRELELQAAKLRRQKAQENQFRD